LADWVFFSLEVCQPWLSVAYVVCNNMTVKPT